jgi:hypothetical protein
VEGQEQVSAPGSGGSLEELGLVDPQSGKALPTSDWAPGPPPAPGTDRSDPNYRQDRFDPDPWAEQTQPATTTQTAGWDSDDNPYKAEALRARQGQDPGVQARTWHQGQAQTIETQAQAAFSHLVSTGMPAEQAQVVIGAARAAALSEAQMQADRLALLPAAKREVADRIAREFSTGNARVTPAEILGEGSVEAMRARARTLSETRRGGAFAARRQAGSDRVERGAGPGSKIDYNTLSPFDTIRLGIARGQFS